ncbi:MAG TPA: hypothetical protein VHZ73_05130 [Vicinamibacterales bacterium]|jgi:hypothetical protein|nr:hypothetical protein [Vicinamibacterales bacterium]
MSHLSPEELIDIADGTSPEPPHVASCGACRRQLAETRAMMGVVADVDVPEPSPLFWERFSARVSEAVAAEPAPAARWFTSWRVAAPLAALATAAALIIAVGVDRRAHTAVPDVPAPVASRTEARAEPRVLLSDDSSDPGLTFVAELASGADIDTSTFTTLDASPADRAVDHLSESELQALAALLKSEMPQERAS